MNELHAALDDLAQSVAGLCEDSPGRPALDAVVADLERMAGAPLPGVDPLPVLYRRFARAHRLLLRQPPTAHVVGRVRHHRSVLDEPVDTLIDVWRAWLVDGAPVRAPVGC